MLPIAIEFLSVFSISLFNVTEIGVGLLETIRWSLMQIWGNSSPVLSVPEVSLLSSNRHFGFANQSVAFVKLSSEQPQTNTDGTMESNTKSVFAENNLFETSDNIVQKR